MKHGHLSFNDMRKQKKRFFLHLLLGLGIALLLTSCGKQYTGKVASAAVVATGSDNEGKANYVKYESVSDNEGKTNDAKYESINNAIYYPSADYFEEWSYDKYSLSIEETGWNIDIAENTIVNIYESGTGKLIAEYNINDELKKISDDYVLWAFPLFCLNWEYFGCNYLEFPLAEKDKGWSDESLYLNIQSGQFFIAEGPQPPENFPDEGIVYDVNYSMQFLDSDYSNIMMQNGYGDCRMNVPHTKCISLSYDYSSGTIENQSLYTNFNLDKSEFEESGYVQFVSNEKSQDYWVDLLFSGADNISWDGVKIYGTASIDGKEHSLTCIDDFYKWFIYDADRNVRTE